MRPIQTVDNPLSPEVSKRSLVSSPTSSGSPPFLTPDLIVCREFLANKREGFISRHNGAVIGKGLCDL